MSDGQIVIPEQLRAAVEADLQPVRAIAAPWKRALYVLPIAVVAMGIPFLYNQLRDMGDLGMLLGWVPGAIEINLAFALLVYAVREGVPGWRASTPAIFAACVAAFALQIGSNILVFLQSPVAGTSPSFSLWMQCFRVESLIGIPILLGVAWLVARTLPQRPWLAGFLAGSGAGLAADASWRLFCPYADVPHVLMGHTGGILVLGLTGFLLGYLWSISTSR